MIQLSFKVRDSRFDSLLLGFVSDQRHCQQIRIGAPNGRELYYHVNSGIDVAGRAFGPRLKMMAVPVETKPVFKAGKPHMLFEGPFSESYHDYAPTPDGRGFIMIRETQSQSAPTELQFVVNWFEELKLRVPAAHDPKIR